MIQIPKNGLTTKIKGDSLVFTNGLFDDTEKFKRFYYDRRMKFIQPTTNVPANNKFSGISQYTTIQIIINILIRITIKIRRIIRVIIKKKKHHNKTAMKNTKKKEEES